MMDDHNDRNIDQEVDELVRAEESKIRDRMLASANFLPPMATPVELKKRGWTAAVLAAVKKFIEGKPGLKRRPGVTGAQGRERAVRNDFEKRETR